MALNNQNPINFNKCDVFSKITFSQQKTSLPTLIKYPFSQNNNSITPSNFTSNNTSTFTEKFISSEKNQMSDQSKQSEKQLQDNTQTPLKSNKTHHQKNASLGKLNSNKDISKQQQYSSLTERVKQINNEKITIEGQFPDKLNKKVQKQSELVSRNSYFLADQEKVRFDIFREIMRNEQGVILYSSSPSNSPSNNLFCLKQSPLSSPQEMQRSKLYKNDKLKQDDLVPMKTKAVKVKQINIEQIVQKQSSENVQNDQKLKQEDKDSCSSSNSSSRVQIQNQNELEENDKNSDQFDQASHCVKREGKFLCNPLIIPSLKAKQLIQPSQDKIRIQQNHSQQGIDKLTNKQVSIDKNFLTLKSYLQDKKQSDSSLLNNQPQIPISPCQLFKQKKQVILSDINSKEKNTIQDLSSLQNLGNQTNNIFKENFDERASLISSQQAQKVQKQTFFRNNKLKNQIKLDDKKETLYLASQLLPSLKFYFDSSSKKDNLNSSNGKHQSDQNQDCNTSNYLSSSAKFVQQHIQNKKQFTEGDSQSEYDKFIIQLINDLKKTKGDCSAVLTNLKGIQTCSQDKKASANINKLCKIIQQESPSSLKSPNYKKQVQLLKFSLQEDKIQNQRSSADASSHRQQMKKVQKFFNPPSSQTQFKQKVKNNIQEEQQEVLKTNLINSQSQNGTKLTLKLHDNSTVRINLQQPNNWISQAKTEQFVNQKPLALSPKKLIQQDNLKCEDSQSSKLIKIDQKQDLRDFYKLRQYYGKKYEEQMLNKMERTPPKQKHLNKSFRENHKQDNDLNIDLDPWENNHSDIDYDDYDQDYCEF